MSKQQSQEGSVVVPFRPPWVSLVYSAVAIYGCFTFYRWQKIGFEPAIILLIGAAVVALFQLCKALDDYFKVQIHRGRRKRFEEEAWKHGSGRWANKQDFRDEELIENNNRHGVLLGSDNGQDIGSCTSNSGNIIGPPGSGKSTSFFIASAFRTIDLVLSGARKNAPSFIFNDPSAQMYGILKKAFEKAGYRVVLLSSWANEVSDLLGERVVDEKLDFIASTIDPKNRPEAVRDDAKKCCKLLIPNEKPGTDEQTKFFNMGGRSIIEFAILYLIWKGFKVTFKNLLNVLQSDFQTLRGMFVEVSETASQNEAKRHEEAKQKAEKQGLKEIPPIQLTIFEELEVYLMSLADGLTGILDKATEQYSGYAAVVQNAIEPYGFGNVQSHTSEGFDATELKYGKKPVAVFVVYPSERVVTHQAMLNAELTHMLETVCKGRPGRSVFGMIDEAFGAGYIPSTLRFLAEGRKFQLRLFLGWQDISQAEYLHSKSGLAQILAAGELLWASGIREPEFCQTLQKMLSEHAVETLSINERSRTTNPMADETFGNQHRGIPLMRDIRTELGSDEVLVLYGNMKPARLKKIPYYTRKAWLKMAGKNPYES